MAIAALPSVARNDKKESRKDNKRKAIASPTARKDKKSQKIARRFAFMFFFF